MSSYPAPNPPAPPLAIYNEQNWYSKTDPTGPVGPQGVQGGLGPVGVQGWQGNQGWQGTAIGPTTTTVYTQTFASPTTTFDIDANGSLQKVVLTASTAFALTISQDRPFVLLVEQGGIGSYTVSWFSTINWSGGTPPTLTTTVGKTDAFGFIRTSSGNYLGYIVGLNA